MSAVPDTHVDTGLVSEPVPEGAHLNWPLFLPSGGKARMGALDVPEFSLFRWGSMIMCTLLAGGGVFWAAGEPMAHFVSPPPVFGDVEALSAAAAVPVSLVLLPSLWDAVRITLEKGREGEWRR